jgi:hypothetical protein
VSRANKNHNLLLTFFQGSVKGGDGLFIWWSKTKFFSFS